MQAIVIRVIFLIVLGTVLGIAAVDSFTASMPEGMRTPANGVSTVTLSKQTVDGKDYIVSDITIAPGGEHRLAHSSGRNLWDRQGWHLDPQLRRSLQPAWVICCRRAVY
jgi:hypothetical protein